ARGIDEVTSLSDSPAEPRVRLKQYRDGQALLLEITRRIARGGSLGAMLPDITNAMRRGSQAQGVRIIVDSLGAALTYGSGPLAGKMVKFDQAITGYVAEHGAVEIPNLSKVGKDQRALSTLSSALGALVALPLMAQHTPQGVVWLGFEKARKFAPEEIAF